MPKYCYSVRAIDLEDGHLVWSSDIGAEVFLTVVQAKRRAKWIKYVFTNLSEYHATWRSAS